MEFQWVLRCGHLSDGLNLLGVRMGSIFVIDSAEEDD